MVTGWVTWSSTVLHYDQNFDSLKNFVSIKPETSDAAANPSAEELSKDNSVEMEKARIFEPYEIQADISTLSGAKLLSIQSYLQ